MKFIKYPMRNAVKDYFPLPNEIFSLGLCPGEISVYAYLLYCEDRKTHECWPSYNTIGNALNISSPKTVRKYVEMLVEKDFIYSKKTKIIRMKYGICKGNMKYKIRPIHEAIMYYDQFLSRKIKNAKTLTEMNRWLKESYRRDEYRAEMSGENSG